MSKITITNRKPSTFWHVDARIMELPAAVLSPEARVLYGYLSSRPGSWEYNRQAAINLLGSKYKLDESVKALKACGLISVNRVRSESGHWAGYEWVINDYDSMVLGDSPKPDIQDTAVSRYTVLPLDGITATPYYRQSGTINNNNTNSNTNNSNTNNKEQPPIVPQGDDAPKSKNRSAGFDVFWSKYPKKVGKAAAEKAWARLKPEQKQLAHADISERPQQDPQWLKNHGQFIPNPATYLNQGRYEDDWRVESQSHQSNPQQSAGIGPRRPVETGDKPLTHAERVRQKNRAFFAEQWAKLEQEQQGAISHG